MHQQLVNVSRNIWNKAVIDIILLGVSGQRHENVRHDSTRPLEIIDPQLLSGTLGGPPFRARVKPRLYDILVSIASLGSGHLG